jgi:hypothetical protein
MLRTLGLVWVKMRKAHGEHFGTAAPLKADPSPRSSERTIRARSGREQSQQNRSIFDHLVTRSDWVRLNRLHLGSPPHRASSFA